MYVTVYKEMGHSRKDPHSPHEEISAVQKGRVEQFVSDNSKCIRTPKRGRWVNFIFPPWEEVWMFFWNDSIVK